MNRVNLHRLTVPVLRIGMGVFLAYWGADKLIDVEGSTGIFSNFYGMDAGALMVQAAGVAEIALGSLLALGLFRVPLAWVQLIVNGVSSFASWRQILDPWAIFGLREGGNAHLFLASIVVMAASLVLVLNARDDTLTLDRKMGRSAGAGAPAP